RATRLPRPSCIPQSPSTSGSPGAGDPIATANGPTARAAAGASRDVSAPLLIVEGLSKAFGGLHALAGLDFSVDEREIVGLIGPNGSGKTTFFNVLTG